MYCIDIASLGLLLLLINFFTGNTSTGILPVSLGWINENYILLLSIFFVFFCIKNWLGYRLYKAGYDFVYTVATRLSQKNMTAYLEGVYGDYVNTDTAVHTRKISQQPVEFAQYVLTGLQQVITQSVLIVITITAVLIYNASLFLLLLAILLPPALLAMRILRKKTMQARLHVKSGGEMALQYLNEALHGYVESNLYQKKDFFNDRYIGRQRQLNNYLSGLQSVQGMPGRMIELFAILGLFILTGISKYSGGSIDVLTLGAFMAAAYKIMPAIVKILNSSAHVNAYAFTLDDLMSIHTPLQPGGNETVATIESISCKNLSFRYTGKTVLQNFNCTINSGDFIGIAGQSGSGKTTLINLLLGFIEPSGGSILFNGKPAWQYDQLSLRKKIAYVKQQDFFIHDNILTNISFEHATQDRQQLENVMAATGIDRLTASFPEGMRKQITENGKNISGGQRQRIATARALYKDADMIILDEPFSELDHDSEKAMLQYFTALAKKGKIILLITHHTPSLAYCTRIINIDEA